MPFKADLMLHLHSPYDSLLKINLQISHKQGGKAREKPEAAELVDIKRALGKVLLMLLTRAYIMHFCRNIKIYLFYMHIWHKPYE